MVNPRVFHDYAVVGEHVQPLGRVVFELFADVVPRTAEKSVWTTRTRPVLSVIDYTDCTYRCYPPLQLPGALHGFRRRQLDRNPPLVQR